MKDSAVTAEIAEPYARALMAVAQDKGLTDQFGEDARQLLEVMGSSDELVNFLASPISSADAKKGVLRQIAGESINPFMVNFLMLLVDRGRITVLGDVLKQYQALLRDLNQAVLAEVTAAMELSDEQKEAIKQKVVGLTGARQVDLDIEIDPSLLGGLIVKVGSQIIDASLRGQLRRIGMQLGAPA